MAHNTADAARSPRETSGLGVDGQDKRLARTIVLVAGGDGFAGRIVAGLVVVSDTDGDQKRARFRWDRTTNGQFISRGRPGGFSLV